MFLDELSNRGARVKSLSVCSDIARMWDLGYGERGHPNPEADTTRVTTMAVGPAYQGTGHWEASQPAMATTPGVALETDRCRVLDVHQARSGVGPSLGLVVDGYWVEDRSGRCKMEDWVKVIYLSYFKQDIPSRT